MRTLLRARRGAPSVGLLDTSLASENEGDRIIVESVLREIPFLSDVPRLPTHKRLDSEQLELARQCDYWFLAGTNALTARVRPTVPWHLGPNEFRALRGRVIPVGVGWRDYEGQTSFARAASYFALFARGIPVSVRDTYTAGRLSSLRIRSTNTACPTMWSLPSVLPTGEQPAEVVATVTDYRPDTGEDSRFVGYLSQRFARVLLWPQGRRDRDYIESLELPPNVSVLDEGLEVFENSMQDRAYVGTRLHAGIRAAQLRRPSLVISVDNRAAEIGRDSGFPIIARSADEHDFFQAIDRLDAPHALNIPHAAQQAWRDAVRQLTGVPA